MAYQTIVSITDDITGEDLDAQEVHVVKFGLDGVNYEMDLSESNAAEFKSMIQRYIDAGRKSAKNGKKGRK